VTVACADKTNVSPRARKEYAAKKCGVSGGSAAMLLDALGALRAA